MSANPWLKFYPSDWRSDPALRMCSVAARGVWIELLALMHEAQPRGDLLINGRQPNEQQLALLVGATVDDVSNALVELEAAGVFSRRKNGVIFSRRMERDENKSRKSRENGQKGGNPTLCNYRENGTSLKGQDKTQNPEARSQKPDKKEGAGKPAPAFSDFWEKSRESWKTLSAPAGGKAEAENAWKKLSNRERWVAYLVQDFYLASIQSQRTATFHLNPKHVCRYLSHRLFREWEDQCTDDDDEAEERPADGRHDSVEHHAASPEPARSEPGRDDHLGGLFPDGQPVRRTDGAGGHAGCGDPVAAGADGGVAEVHHLNRWRIERQMPPDYRGADVPRRSAVAGELSDAMAGRIHGRSQRQSRLH